MIDRLTLQQWLSPAFPLGSFAYSQGLETAMVAGHVRDAETLRIWLDDILTHGAGQTDAILLTQARQAEDPADLIALARALAPSRERHLEAEEQGQAFARTLRGLGHDCPEGPFPVLLGWASRTLALEHAEVAALYLQAFAANLISAAVRFVPLGQTEGQKVLAAIQPTLARLGARAAESPLSAIGTSTPGADLAALAHETLQPRIFKT